ASTGRVRPPRRRLGRGRRGPPGGLPAPQRGGQAAAPDRVLRGAVHGGEADEVPGRAHREGELGVKIVWLEAWENPLNERLRAAIDNKNQCGGVPYLFNRKTGKVLCGVQSYDKLRLWAQGLGGDARIYRDIGGDDA
ncbi:unnamed protein product, partial [Prorocentrum cordatum]